MAVKNRAQRPPLPLLPSGTDPAGLNARAVYHFARHQISANHPRLSKAAPRRVLKDIISGAIPLTERDVDFIADAVGIDRVELTRPLTDAEQSEWAYYRFSASNGHAVWKQVYWQCFRRGLHHKDVAALLGISASHFTDVLNGRKNHVLDFASASALCDILGSDAAPQMFHGSVIRNARSRTQHPWIADMADWHYDYRPYKNTSYIRGPADRFPWKKPCAANPAHAEAFHREAKERLLLLADWFGWHPDTFRIWTEAPDPAYPGRTILQHPNIRIQVEQLWWTADKFILMRCCSEGESIGGNFYSSYLLLEHVPDLAKRVEEVTGKMPLRPTRPKRTKIDQKLCYWSQAESEGLWPPLPV